MLRNTLRMIYKVRGAEGTWSDPRVFETRDGKEWERAVNVVHENEDGYKILKVERVEDQ